MEYGLIKDTTIQAIADGLRDKGIVDKYKLVPQVFKFKNKSATSLDDPTPASMVGARYEKIRINTISDATLVEVIIDFVETIKNEVAFIIYKDAITGSILTIGVTNELESPLTVRVPNDSDIEFWYEGTPYFGVTLKAYPLDADGNNYLVPGDEIREYTPTEIAEQVANCLAPPPRSSLTFTGDCSSKFTGGGWNWFLNYYGDECTTKDITKVTKMFYSNPSIEHIQMELNLSANCESEDIFGYSTKLKELPRINNLRNAKGLCTNCSSLVSINNNKLTNVGATLALDSTFSSCPSLRDIGDFFAEVPDVVAGNSIFGMYNTFQYCYSLRRLESLPFVYSTYGNTYFFDGCFKKCHMLSKLTFRNQVVGVVTKTCTLDLSDNTGYANGSPAQLDAQKRVYYDGNYQELKDDPDWWTDMPEYSRYNHDSAVETINSLPDVTINGTNNTIKFKGAAGSKTDGGAINTLTPEEIAVADAKGWTVTLV